MLIFSDKQRKKIIEQQQMAILNVTIYESLFKLERSII